MAGEAEQIDDMMVQVEECLKEYTAHFFAGSDVERVLDDAVSDRGKMIRPRLLLICAAFGPRFEERRDTLCEIAAIVEMTHMASLIHDDIVDDGVTRRGKPSIQYKYGKDAAVYAGDFLMSRISCYISRDHLNESGVILSQTVESMCTGEIGQAMCRYREDATAEEYLKNIQGKTAALFMAACRIGALEAGCDDALINQMNTFGESVGIMFQLRDDLLDFLSDREVEGKELHRDFCDGVYTLPLICALQAPEAGERLLGLVRKNRTENLSAGEFEEFENLVAELGGIEATIKEIYVRQIRAEDIILSALPQNAYVLELLRMIRKLGDISV